MNFFEWVERTMTVLGDKTDEIIGKYPNIFLAISAIVGFVSLSVIKPKSQIDVILLPFMFVGLMMGAVIVVVGAKRKMKERSTNI